MVGMRGWSNPSKLVFHALDFFLGRTSRIHYESIFINFFQLMTDYEELRFANLFYRIMFCFCQFVVQILSNICFLDY